MRQTIFQFGLILMICVSQLASGSERRQTPLVNAVEKAQTAVVNIHTQKDRTEINSVFSASNGGNKINGMGTGIVFDENGYIITNYHVVADVQTLEVSLVDGSRFPAELISYDRKKDLAVIKIDAPTAFEVMAMGTSSDLMLGETVFTIGNPFGYSHTVTSGIVSALSRDVEVNETQSYYNLIQTDASINPGNSGGPLLNLDGEVIGINVAIRQGAQRIGFAIPIDDAREVIANLISVEMLKQQSHGLNTVDQKTGESQSLVVQNTIGNSPAEEAGFQTGDEILSINERPVIDRVDFERVLLDLTDQSEEQFTVKVKRGEDEVDLAMSLMQLPSVPRISGVELARKIPTSIPVEDRTLDARVWDLLGMKLTPLPEYRAKQLGSKYQGGMQVTAIRSRGPASKIGIRKGDVLVGLHVWETVSYENVSFIVKHPQLKSFSPLAFYIVRGKETFYGHLDIRK